MQFFLINAPTTFYILVNKVLQLVLDYFIIVFFDDIMVCNTTLKEHA